VAQVAGFGLSHYPGLLVPAQFWPQMLTLNVKKGRLAAEVFHERQRWPESMRAEWGDDAGKSAAMRHRDALVRGYRLLRRQLDAFAPDLVLIWGDDQYENYRDDCIPAFAVGMFDEIVCRPYGRGRSSFGTDESAWGLSPDAPLTIPCHYDAAEGLMNHLLNDGFDPAYSLSTQHADGLAHAFANTVLFLDPDRRGFPYPVVPFHVNCYGRQLLRTGASSVGAGRDGRLTPPAPSPARCFAIGESTARHFAATSWRVALVASSSWSHGSLTVKHGRLFPDEKADHARLEELRQGQFDRWRTLTGDALEDAGQHEFLNWICLAGAMSELGQQAEMVDFVRTLLFNSSKCFAYFPPRSLS
jgi:hypothetical protein